MSTDLNSLKIAAGRSETDSSGSLPSGRKKNTTIKSSAAMAASKAKTTLQFQAVTINPPIVGASIGETPSMSISNEIMRALSLDGKKSNTIAIAATAATQPLSASKNRINQNISIE